MTVSAAAFARLVAENDLRPIKIDGYRWAWLPTEDGFDTYRTFAEWDTIPVSSAATADPAAGADPAAVTVAAGKRMLLLGLYCQNVTDANVASRVAALTITDGTNTVAYFMHNASQAASTTRQVNFACGIGSPFLANTVINIGLPANGIELPAGYTFQVTHVNIQATDDCTAVRYIYKEASV